MNCYIGGLVEGYNFPKGMKEPWIDLNDCKDVIIVDRKYFLDHIGLLKSWAEEFDNKGETK